MAATWKIVCPDGLWTSAQVFYKGERVNSVVDVTVRVEIGMVVTATLTISLPWNDRYVNATVTVQDVEVEIGPLARDDPHDWKVRAQSADHFEPVKVVIDPTI